MTNQFRTHQRSGIRWVVVPLLALILAAAWSEFHTARPKHYRYRVVRAYPHDEGAFTQGLLYSNGELYESTGGFGESSVRRVDLTTGRPSKLYSLPPTYFGEGLALLRGRLFGLTWRNHIALEYSQDSIGVLHEREYLHEGWGLTTDGMTLLASDGTATVRIIDPVTFHSVSSFTVRDANGPVQGLNELEYVDGEVFANVFLTDQIVRFSVASGRVTGWIDLSGLMPSIDRQLYPMNVLNGIAYDAHSGHLLVTGKRWPNVFEIELLETPKD